MRHAACTFLALLLSTGAALGQCVVSTSGVNFGTYVDGETATSTGGLHVTCDSGIPFTIELSQGSGDFAQRQMLGPGAASLLYNLYTGADYSQIWGDGVASGTSTVGGVGNGGTQTFTVFGQMPGSQAPSSGAYIDNITVTVAF